MAGRLKSSERRLRAQQAKEILISQVVEQAQMDNVPLSDVERKMLYFTETEETPPDMPDVNDEFEREYDSVTYEKKIAGLLRNAFKRSRRESPDSEYRWKQSIAALRNEDHYLLVMVDQAALSARPPGDRIKLWSTGFAIVGLIAGASLVAARYDVDLDKYFPSRSTLSFVIWGIVAVLAIVFGALWLLLGKQRMDKLFVIVVERVFASTSREK